MSSVPAQHEGRHLLVTGLVQGVNFRRSLQAEACRLQLRGWVRNLSDGRVEACVVGAPASLAAILAWAAHGPPAAQVTRVWVEVLEGERLAETRCEDFVVWPDSALPLR